ncbi:30S ribosomal protein S16 [Phocaeicola abscessus]|uniref:30S ribosomal protein S16 n=1 Tax=Phocaeicola abscessus TaxID=555313 RepID=UPI0028E2024E|nr:30S ribosomal protein S16 [Phocaeicola abscessus]
MATRIRLQRRGRKGYAFYSIVIADARAPRDGRFIEKIGTYNPNTNPAAVDLNFERALHWVLVGAQPTDTVRNLLSREGVYMKKHLLGGVAKGAFNEAEAETKFEAWKNDKQNGLKALKDKIDADKKAAAKVRLEAEKKVNEEIAAKVAEKKAAEAATKAAEEAATKVAEAEEAKAEEAKVAEEAKATEETTATLPTEEAAPVEEAPKTEA